MIIIFISVLLLLADYTNVFFRFDISLGLFLLLLLLNALLYLNFFFLNVKEAFSNTKGSRNLLSLNYFIKLVTTIITIFLISSNIALIFDSYSLYKQRTFFKEYSDYYYTKLEYKPIWENNNGHGFNPKIIESSIVQDKFYKTFFHQFDATLLTSTYDLENSEGILANKNSLDYLLGEMKTIKHINLNKEYYILVPNELSGSLSDEELDNFVDFYGRGISRRDQDIIYYEENVEIISIDEELNYDSKLVENPIILYINIDESLTKKQIGNNLNLSYTPDIMYKISEGDLNKFIREHNLKDQIITITNVLENYNYKWNLAKRILLINFIFSALILFVEFIVICTIIRMEYEINAIELSIKKILGHNMLEKNFKIIFITIITSSLSILSIVTVSNFLQIDKKIYLIIGGLLILLLELLVISYYSRKMERTKIPKILKGGNL